MNYRDLKKLIPPKKEKIDFSGFWFTIKVIFGTTVIITFVLLYAAIFGYIG